MIQCEVKQPTGGFTQELPWMGRACYKFGRATPKQPCWVDYAGQKERGLPKHTSFVTARFFCAAGRPNMNTLENHPSRLLSVEQVADFIGVSPKTLRRYHDQRLLPEPIRLGGRLLIKWRLQDIAQWVDRQVEGVQQ